MELSVFFIIYFTVAAIWAGFCGWLAVEKGRSGQAWMLIGFIFGPIALLTLVGAPIFTKKSGDALAQPNREDRKKEEPESLERKKEPAKASLEALGSKDERTDHHKVLGIRFEDGKYLFGQHSYIKLQYAVDYAEKNPEG